MLVLKQIEERILELLASTCGVSNPTKIKLLATPQVDFDTVRQNIIVNVQYNGETFINIGEKKAMLTALPTKKRVSDIKFVLQIYYKDLRKSYDDIYELFDNIVYILHGEIIELDNAFCSTPMIIENIEFVERNSQSYYLYRCNLSLRISK